ncbi:hypothetical protein HNV11_12395 [Spirosoma taeanense]|uniref:Uncharacterized protein n=1 Tax=Spirosoma taeanense TaxID=2735870 RepID=A0A6M5Y8A0_9BACT|nr:hypothetical protein [Spirosoma taeanense]QJW90119.1 hypothetical protein HNV11_12395 [Spirosoma taeanense]
MEWLIVTQKLFISAFVGLLTVLLLFWCLPEGYFFREILHRHFGKYICWAGLDNYWALFAPRPVSKNFLIGFEIELADGTLQAWKLPQYSIVDDYQATSHFRFIKMHNQLLSQKDPIPKEAICKYILHEYGKQPQAKSPPIKVHIIQYYEPAPDSTFYILPWLSRKIYTYDLVDSHKNQPYEPLIYNYR